MNTLTKITILLSVMLLASCSDDSPKPEKPEDPKIEEPKQPDPVSFQPSVVKYNNGGLMSYAYSREESTYNDNDELVLTRRMVDSLSEYSKHIFSYQPGEVIVTEELPMESEVPYYSLTREGDNTISVFFDKWKALTSDDRTAEFSYGSEEVTIDYMQYYSPTNKILRSRSRLEFTGNDITSIKFDNQNGVLIVELTEIKYDSTLNPFYKSLRDGFFGSDPLELIQQLSRHTIRSCTFTDISSNATKEYTFQNSTDEKERLTSRTYRINNSEPVLDFKITYRN